MQREDVGDPSCHLSTLVFLPQNAVEKRKMRSKVLSCTYRALPSAIIVATVNLMATSAWAEHYPSWFQGCAQAVGGVVLQRKRPMAALLHYCQALSDCRTVGRAVGLSDDAYRPPHRDCCQWCQTLSDTVRTVRTVRLSEYCRNTVGLCYQTVGPHRGSGPDPFSRSGP